jgi:ferredoxin-NADP reductase
MLKIKLFNATQPLQTRELEFPAAEAGEYAIGNSSNCAIPLSSPRISEITAVIRHRAGQYSFIALDRTTDCQYNQEKVEIDRSYHLSIDDIIRIREYVLIVAAVPMSEKPVRERKLTTAIKKKIKPSENGYISPTEPIKTRIEPKNIPLFTPPSPISPSTLEKDLTLRCLAVIDETHDVKTFRFLATDSRQFRYKAGQFITLKLNIDGKSVLRSYSISSTPSRPDVLEITVKRVPSPPDLPHVPPGLVSNWLHDHLKAGDILETKGISGKFSCVDHPSRQLLLISAGSGITPLMAMTRWLYDTGKDHDIIFFHSARDREDIIYDRELQLLNQRNPRFHLAISLTRSQDQSWEGLTGRLDAKMLQAIASDYKERTVYVCGPDTFMSGVKNLLASLAFPMNNYYEESFGSGKKVKKEKTGAGTGEKTSLLIFRESGKEIASDGQETILDIAAAEGIEINSSCRSGNCGTCKVRKLAGEVKYEGEPKGLEATEAEAGYILACIAYPVATVTIAELPL